MRRVCALIKIIYNGLVKLFFTTEYKKKGSVAKVQWYINRLCTAINTIEVEQQHLRNKSHLNHRRNYVEESNNKNLCGNNFELTFSLEDHIGGVKMETEKLQKHAFALVSSLSSRSFYGFELAERFNLTHIIQ